MHDNRVPEGVWPAMVTPLNADQSIDWQGVSELVEWYIDSGVAGLFAVGQSGEMFALSDDERLQLATHVVRQAAGRVPVVASGTFGGAVEAQAEFVKRMGDVGVVAVTVIASEIAGEEDDDAAWRRNLETLMRLTDPVPLALYECPQPYHRLISPEQLAWAASSGRFWLMKETSRSLDAVKAKVAATEGTVCQVFNADTTALLPSLQAGAAGYCGIGANFYPDLLAWLCAHYEDQPELAFEVQSALASFDPAIHFKYPVCAKEYLRAAGFNIQTVSRISDAVLTAYDRRVIDGIATTVARLREKLAAVAPTAQ